MIIDDLNDKYLASFGIVYHNRTLVSEKQKDYMNEVLESLYKLDVKDLLDDRLLEFSERRFERQFKIKNYIPRRRLLFLWNPVAKKLLKKYVAEFKTFLAELEKNTREETEYATELNQGSETAHEEAHPLQEDQCTALTTPSETGIAE